MVRLYAAMFGCSVALAGTIDLAQAANYKVVHLFPYDGDGPSGDGANPAASLTNVAGTLYGTTELGGQGFGTVFSLSPQTGTEQVVYAFTQVEGFYPVAGLINFRDTLYGTTESGGDVNKCSYGCGVVFSFNPASGAEKLVLPFEGREHGKYPTAGLIQVGGTFYGTTTQGGKQSCSGGCGTIFSLNPKTGAEKTVHLFHGGSDGAYPYGSLINVGGTLYGTTQEGGVGCGSQGCGTVFSLDPATGVEKIAYAFQGGDYGPDGVEPMAGLINVGGTLYGTTLTGGNSAGTVFSLNPATGAEKVVYDFLGGNDGSLPQASLIDVGGKLYGTTSAGGSDPNGDCGNGCGTVFSLDPATGKEQVLYSFQGFTANDGAVPLAALINVGGTLYGTTSAGGVMSCYNNNVFGCGTVFAITP